MVYSNMLGQIRVGVRSGLLVQTPSLLDTYSAAELAFSLRRLKSTYSGYAIKVRRSNDNLEQDISFDINGDLDTTSLLNFAGSLNTFLYSEQFDNSYWHKNSSSIAPNMTTAPDGTLSADLWNEDPASWHHSIGKSTQTLWSSGTSYNTSVYLKKGSGVSDPNTIALGFGEANTTTLPYAIYNISTGVVVISGSAGDSNFGASIVDAGNGWWRCSIFGTVATSANRLPIYVRFVNNQNTLPGQYLGKNSQIFIWGYQAVTAINDTSVLVTKPYNKTTTVLPGDIYITRWYDQSGNNRHATQTTAASQPQIVSGGSIIKINSKPAAYFNGSNEIGVTYSTSKALNLYFLTTTTDTQYLYPWTTLSTYGFVAQSGNGSAPHSGYGSAVLYTNFNLRDSSTRDVVCNNLLGTKIVTHQNASISGWGSPLNFGSYTQTYYSYIGYLQEWTIYPATYSVSLIQSNMNSYFQVIPSVSDSDAQTFIGAAGLTSSTQASAINTLVTSLKTSGLWTKMKAIYPFVGGSATTHKYNLKDPRDLNAAYRLLFSGTWTHTSTGAKPNGSSYAETYFNNTRFISTSKASVGLYSRTNRDSGNTPMAGWQDSVSNVSIFPNYGSKAYFSLNDPSAGVITANTNYINVTDSLGFYQVSRNNSTTQLIMAKNNYTQTGNAGVGSTNSITIKLGAGWNQYNIWGADIIELSFAYFGDDLSSTDLVNYYNIVQTYQTSLGRQV